MAHRIKERQKVIIFLGVIVWPRKYLVSVHANKSVVCWSQECCTSVVCWSYECRSGRPKTTIEQFIPAYSMLERRQNHYSPIYLYEIQRKQTMHRFVCKHFANAYSYVRLCIYPIIYFTYLKLCFVKAKYYMVR